MVHSSTHIYGSIIRQNKVKGKTLARMSKKKISDKNKWWEKDLENMFIGVR